MPLIEIARTTDPRRGDADADTWRERIQTWTMAAAGRVLVDRNARAH